MEIYHREVRVVLTRDELARLVKEGRIEHEGISVVVKELSERDRINALLRIVQELEKGGMMASKPDIEERMWQEHEIAEGETNALLERLRRDGELYEPKAGHYKIV